MLQAKIEVETQTAEQLVACLQMLVMEFASEDASRGHYRLMALGALDDDHYPVKSGPSPFWQANLELHVGEADNAT